MRHNDQFQENQIVKGNNDRPVHSIVINAHCIHVSKTVLQGCMYEILYIIV
jgi:hypothetical protein